MFLTLFSLYSRKWLTCRRALCRFNLNIIIIPAIAGSEPAMAFGNEFLC
jgi:hypothetical protein